MISSVMSIFDPCLSFNFPINWLVIMVPFFMVPASLWMLKEGLKLVIITKIKSTMDFSCSFLLTSLFILILTINLAGMIPSSYPLSSSAWFGFSMSLPFWLTSLMSDLTYKQRVVLSHLVPETSQIMMGFLLVWIEITSMMMRPLSLGVRLLANITAGHILMNLIESSMSFNSPVFSSLQMITFLTLEGLEVAVAMIQAYVFTQLLFLYWVEIN